MKRHKEQGVYRLNKALKELSLLFESIDEIKDEIDIHQAKLDVEEIRWCVKEGLQDLLEGE